MRIGFGYDSHRLVSGRKLILGGVEIPHSLGSLGHSDADALLHAICDAVLGAIGAGDIGCHFPDNDETYKDISSLILLQRVMRLVDEKGLALHNLDCTVILERPQLKNYLAAMTANIAAAIQLAPSMVNIKAKTNEGMGWVGKNEGVAAFAVVTIKEKQD